MRTGMGASSPASQGRRVPDIEGFTMIEVIIFLAISGLLFLIAAGTIGGQQAKTEFSQSVQNFQSRLLDLANDISAGYYVNEGNFSCLADEAAGSVVSISAPTAATRGQNTGCVFVGQALFFNTTPPQSTFTLTPLAGKQRTTTPGGLVRQVQNLNQARPDDISIAQTTESISYGTVTAKVTYDDGTAGSPHTAVGVLISSTFGAYASTDLGSGDIQADIWPLTTTTPVWENLTVVNPKNGITICLQDNPSGPTRYAQIILGGVGRQLTAEMKTDAGGCP